MASNQTQNYGLSQWELTDNVRMEDFNEDNAKIDAALAGMPRVITGSYTGTGGCGAANPTKLTLDFPARFLFVWGDYARFAMGIRGQSVKAISGSNSDFLSASWNGNTVSWYYNGNTAQVQMNDSGHVYYYLAIG